MKKLFLLFGFLFLFSPVVLAENTSSLQAESIGGKGQQIFQAYAGLQNLRNSMTQKEIALNFEKNFDFPSLKEIARIDGELLVKFEELASLEAVEGMDYDGKYVLEEQISDLKKQRQLFEDAYEARRIKQQQKIAELSVEIEDIDEEIVRQEQLFRAQAIKAAGYFGILFAVIIVLLVFKFLVKLLIKRVTDGFPDNRKDSLHKINSYVFNTIIVLVIIGGFFSQLVNVLPFIAILGTGMAFAVRDSISCFIAWFVIGTKRGYKVGDIIRVGDVFGKVYEIGPFLTVISGMEGGQRTNRFLSFPNKVIFEHEIEHYSFFQGIGEKRVSFYVKPEADISALEIELMRLARDTETFSFFDNSSSAAKKTFEKNDPQVLVSVEPKGVKIDLLFFADIERGSKVASEISRAFLVFVSKKFPGVIMASDSPFNLAHKK